MGRLALSPHRARLLPAARTERRRDLVELHVEPDPEPAGAADFAVVRGRSGTASDASSGRLPIDQRAVMVLHFYLDLPLTEAADILDIPVGTAKSRLHRGPGGPADAMRRRAATPSSASVRERPA